MPSAQAHADLVHSNPAAGSQLKTLPTEVTVQFDDDLLVLGGAKTNVLAVRDPQGRQVDLKNSKVSGATLTVGLSPSNVTGTFTVSWRVVSGDGHPVEGTFQFAVGTQLVSPSPQSSAPSSKNPNVQSESFWSRYQTRIYLALGLILATLIWARFDRTRRKSE